MTPDQMSEILRRRRRALGLSQVQLAALAEVSLPTIQNIEGGKASNPSIDILNKLASELGLELRLDDHYMVNWDYLAVCGVPILMSGDAEKTKAKSKSNKRSQAWNVHNISRELKNAIAIAVPRTREWNALMAYALALTTHYEHFIKNNDLKFLISFVRSNKKWIRGEHIKLRRIALAYLQNKI